MRAHSISSGLRSLYLNRGLLRSLVARDIESRYRGTVLGLLWSVVNPVLMLLVYALIFSGVFNVRWGGVGDVSDFVSMLYCGLIIHGFFSETLSRSPSAILSNPSYVTKIVFPLELLPTSQLVSAAFNSVIGILLLSLFLLFERNTIPYSVAYVPIVMAPFFLLTAGLAWLLSALGVFLRDIGQIISVVMSVLLFLSPVFYPVSAVPAVAQAILYFNPLTVPMEELRTVLVLGRHPNWELWSTYSVVSAVTALLGLWVFQKARSAFADVL
jgi:lipopolysaccharide transport system permease protein